MRPHHLLEACLRVLAIYGIVEVITHIPTTIREWPGESGFWAGCTMVWPTLVVPPIYFVLLLWSAPRLCRWMHEATSDAHRASAAQARVAILRIGVALIGLEQLAWSVHHARWIVLAWSGVDVDATRSAIDGGLLLVLCAVLILTANTLARRVDEWGSAPLPTGSLAE